MTVKELIQELLEYDIDAEVEVKWEISSYEYEMVDFTVQEEYQISGKNTVSLAFELDENVVKEVAGVEEE